MINQYSTKEEVLVAVSQDGYALEYASEALKNDIEVVLAAVRQNGYALFYASEALRKNRKVVLAAVNESGHVLLYLSEALKNDKEVVLAAVGRDGVALQYASEALRKDRKVVLAAVTQFGYALEYASEALRKDRKVVLAAVGQSGRAFRFASEELQNDMNFVLRAIRLNPDVLEYVPDSFKKYQEAILSNSKDFVLTKVAEDGEAIRYLSEDFLNDVSFMWQVFSLSSEENDAARKDYVNAFLIREILKLSLGLAGITLGGLLLSGVIALPIPAMAVLIVGGCLASAGALYSGHKLYQHGLGFFNAKSAIDPEADAFPIP